MTPPIPEPVDRPPRSHAGPRPLRTSPSCWTCSMPAGRRASSRPTTSPTRWAASTGWPRRAAGSSATRASCRACLEADGVPMTTGYVEAVATHPDWRRRGIASRLMTLGERAHRRDVRAGRPVHGPASRVRAARVGAVAGADVRPHGRRPGADRGRGRRDHGPAHAPDAAARGHRGAQLRVARGRRLVGTPATPVATPAPVRPFGRCRPGARSRPSRSARTSRASGSPGPSGC